MLANSGPWSASANLGHCYLHIHREQLFTEILLVKNLPMQSHNIRTTEPTNDNYNVLVIKLLEELRTQLGLLIDLGLKYIRQNM